MKIGTVYEWGASAWHVFGSIHSKTDGIIFDKNSLDGNLIPKPGTEVTYEDGECEALWSPGLMLRCAIHIKPYPETATREDWVKWDLKENEQIIFTCKNYKNQATV